MAEFSPQASSPSTICDNSSLSTVGRAINIVTNLSNKTFRTAYKNFYERKKLLLQDYGVSGPIYCGVLENVPPYEHLNRMGAPTSLLCIVFGPLVDFLNPFNEDYYIECERTG